MIIFCLVFSFSSFSQNGYTLEFENTILLSHDTTASIPAGIVKIKQYTVPSGMVLKINGGILNDYLSSNSFLQLSELIIGNQVIKPLFALSSAGPQNVSIAFGGGLNGLQPIWANEGTVVQLKYINNTINSIPWIRGCWISGILFRKIPN